jgi:hypothetical protein
MPELRAGIDAGKLITAAYLLTTKETGCFPAK